MPYFVARIEKGARYKNYVLGYGLPKTNRNSLKCYVLATPSPTACAPSANPISFCCSSSHQFKRILVIISNQPAWVMFIEQ